MIDMSFRGIGTFKDILWLIVICVFFCAFTLWAFNLAVLTILFLVFVIRVSWQFWFADSQLIKIGSRSGTLKRVNPREYPSLIDTVTRCCDTAGIPVPKVYLSGDQELNAYASGRSPANSIVVINETLLRRLTPTQMMGVISHEVSHIANRDCLNQAVCMVFCEALQFQADMLRTIFLMTLQTFRLHFIFGLIIFLLCAATLIPLVFLSQAASLVVVLIVRNLSRTRELRADETGAGLCNAPIALAEALEILDSPSAISSSGNPHELPLKIRQLCTVNPSAAFTSSQSVLGQAVNVWIKQLFSTHPPTGERSSRLRSIASEITPGRQGF